MYYICKFSGTWTILDSQNNKSRILDPTEIECLKILFPGLLSENGKLLTALQVSTIQLNKLSQLSLSEESLPLRKTQGQNHKGIENKATNSEMVKS
jgi:hypothetical protein